ncbi:MAG: glycoside hydrolase family 3 protein [Saprospiraceae bacterium]
MKKVLKAVLYLLGGLVVVILIIMIAGFIYFSNKARQNMALALEPSPRLTEQGYSFRDLNKNGRLDAYEDARQPLEKRVEDLLSQMTLEEKAGMMFITMAGMGPKGTLHERPYLGDMMSLFLAPNPELILRKKMNHVNALAGDAIHIMKWANAIQALADRSRLGIPVTIASDPRHVFSYNPIASLPTPGFSQWPEPLGFAAIGDTALMQQFADIARREYRAIGIHLALHPMADLATEPRWPRINGTFGEDAELAARMVYHYIKGFQGDTLSGNSVACMTKHFSGGGPQKDGLDPHFEFGQEQVYPGNYFQYHIIPFKAALAAGTAQMMPYYGIPMDQTDENVGFAFNKKIISGILRNELGFEGVVCTDWGLLTDKKLFGVTVFPATGWGVKNLTPAERIVKALDAGVDQFGGEMIPEVLVELVKAGKVPESRLDESVRRLLRDKFRLGLFENPLVDEARFSEDVGRTEDIALGDQTQGRAMVLLKNKENTLPLQKGIKIYIENINKEIAAQYGTVVKRPEDADLAIIRLQTPYQLHGDNMMAAFFHHDDLDFKDKEKAHIISLLQKVPTIVDIYLDRPAVIPEIAAQAQALLGNFGAKDKVLLDVVFGCIQPVGKLPFELPASMQAVYEQKEDVPYDSKNPLFKFGYGLQYNTGNKQILID